MAEPLLPCPICGYAARHIGIKGGYEIARCTKCEHGFIVNLPSPDDLAKHYEYERGLQHVQGFVYPILASVLRRFAPFRSTNRLLDVGFGAGAMLRVAAELGWEAHGIEIARSAIEAARAAGIRAELVEGDFLTFPYESLCFDIVIFDGIVANLPYPKAFFSRAHEVLRPGGLLYVTTLHGRGLSCRVLGTAWSVLAPPEVLHLFSTRSLTIAARDGGFSRTRTYTRGVNPYELLNVFRRSMRTARGTDVNAALLSTGSGRLIKRIANAALRLTGLGDQLYLEAVA